MEFPKLTRNAVRCLHCGDVIESKTVNDFVTCSCGKAAVDGGLLYRRRVGFESDMEDLSEFESENASPEN